MKKLSILIVLLFLSLNSYALTVQVSTKGVLDSNLTPDVLVGKLTEELKKQALSKAPTYVENKQTLNTGTGFDDSFTEKIISLGAGYVELMDISKVWGTSDSGLPTLSLSGSANVDMKALDMQVANIRRNRSMEERVKLAVSEIEKLQRQIDSIDLKLSQKGEHGNRQRLAKKRDHLITQVLASADTSTLYQVSYNTRKRLLLSYDLFSNKQNSLEQGHAVGEKIYNYLEKNLVLSPPTLSVKSSNLLDVTFTYGFDPLPIVGLLEKYYDIKMMSDHIVLTPLFNGNTYEGDVVSTINQYLDIKVGVKVSTITQWEPLLKMNGDLIKLHFGHGPNSESNNGSLTISMSLPDELVSNPVGLTVGKSI